MAVADFYLSNAPSQTALLILAQVASARHAIEEILEDAKGELGLADYEGRSWKSWYRHMTLVMAALTWLSLLRLPDREKTLRPQWMRLSLAEVRRLVNIFMPLPPPTPAFQVHWLWWRRLQRMRAICSHYGIDPRVLPQPP